MEATSLESAGIGWELSPAVVSQSCRKATSGWLYHGQLLAKRWPLVAGFDYDVPPVQIYADESRMAL